MSETQSKSAALVAAKIQKLRDEQAEAGDNTEQKFAVYDKYNIFFDGIKQGMEVAGATEQDIRAVVAARSMISKQLDALEAEAVLAEALAQG